MIRNFLICSAIAFTLNGCSRATQNSVAGKQNTTTTTNIAATPEAGSRYHNVLHLRWLAPAQRFTEYAAGENHRAAQEALNAGDVEDAYNMFGSRDPSIDGPREKRFDDVLETAFQQWSKTTPASVFAERVQTYWLPALIALSTEPPRGVETCRSRTAALNEFAQDVIDGKALKFTPAQFKTVSLFKKELQVRQAAAHRQCG